MRRTSYSVALCLGLLAALASPATAGWWDAAGGAKETTLADLRRDPERWRDVTIVVPVRFESVPERVNPFFTQFHPGKWQPLAVRAAGARDGAEIVFERIFVQRGTELGRRLGRLAVGEPLLLRGVVRDTAGDEPWIEVLRITRAEDGLTPEEEGRIRQADRFLAKSNPIAAEQLYRAVLDARKLGDGERGQLRAKLGAAFYAQGRLEDARTELLAALDADPLDRATAERLERVTAALAAPKSAPPTARIARPAPEPPPELREPLTLPGDRPRLAPPKGLDRGGVAPLERPPTQTAAPRRPQPAPLTPPLTPPVTPPLTPHVEEPAARVPVPASVRADTDAARRLPAPPRPIGAKPRKPLPAPEPVPVEEEEEEPDPPLPSRPPLVGPK